MGATFEVVAEPTRRRILDLLVDREHAVGELVDGLRVSQPAVSKHLKVLREAGLVSARVDAQRRLYAIRPDPLKEIDAWLAPYRSMWESSLDALEAHLHQVSGGRRPRGATATRPSRSASPDQE
jgi:DNA-binding transcriptional ArsR family regulator